MNRENFKLTDIQYLYSYVTTTINLSSRKDNEFYRFQKDNIEQYMHTEGTDGREYRVLEDIFSLYNPYETNIEVINDLICSRDIDNQTIALNMLKGLNNDKNNKKES